jgi:hypothetical protein
MAHQVLAPAAADSADPIDPIDTSRFSVDDFASLSESALKHALLEVVDPAQSGGSSRRTGFGNKICD